VLFAPHTSAGRLPTDAGVRLFVNGLLEVGRLSEDERRNIDGRCAASGRSVGQVLEEASELLSGLSQCAGVVFAPKVERSLRHIECAPRPGGRWSSSSPRTGWSRTASSRFRSACRRRSSARHHLNARLSGRTIEEAKSEITAELESHQAQLDELASRVDGGLAFVRSRSEGALIIRGQSNLLGNVTAIEDLEKIRTLFEMLEAKDSMLRLLDATQIGEGVQIFIGAEHNLFANTGCSVVIAPYHNSREQIVGAIGVIGPHE
jgi:heat-inducible transcriptional repressor